MVVELYLLVALGVALLALGFMLAIIFLTKRTEKEIAKIEASPVLKEMEAYNQQIKQIQDTYRKQMEILGVNLNG